MRLCVDAGIPVKAEGNFQETTFSFHVGSRGETWVIRPGGKCHYWQSNLVSVFHVSDGAEPFDVLLKCELQVILQAPVGFMIT